MYEYGMDSVSPWQVGRLRKLDILMSKLEVAKTRHCKILQCSVTMRLCHFDPWLGSETSCFLLKIIHSLECVIYKVLIAKWSAEGTTILVAGNRRKGVPFFTDICGVAFHKVRNLCHWAVVSHESPIIPSCWPFKGWTMSNQILFTILHGEALTW